eukprot:TRINITY_DN1796_c0_g1_i1.p1 TRINITY_DN1796_c0_g1~~TRINITY_DN1796_c0_g1_i1.p1  ORF type:complete len:360 (+),score=60.96 TRINITY_DN1796_c0_g1_i1:78-1157(+)
MSMLANECPVCSLLFSTEVIPKVLSCGHSLCHRCSSGLPVAAKLGDNKCVSCPMCREITEVDARRGFPTNFALLELIKQVRGGGGADKLDLKYEMFDEKSQDHLRLAGKLLFIRSFVHNLHLQCKEDQVSVATVPHAESWESWTIEEVGEDVVVIKNMYFDMYLKAVPEALFVTQTGDPQDPDAHWKVGSFKDGTHCFRACNSLLYLRVDASSLVTLSEDCTPEEHFLLVQPAGTKCHLMSHDGRYLQLPEELDIPLMSEEVNKHCEWFVVDLWRNVKCIKHAHRQVYLRAGNDGDVNVAMHKKDWEHWTFEVTDSSCFGLKSAHNNFLRCVGGDNALILSANLLGEETWRLLPIDQKY